MQILSNPITALDRRITEIFASVRKSGSRNMTMTSDWRAEVEIWPFRACVMHPPIIIVAVESLWTWLRGRYHVSQNIFLVHIENHLLHFASVCSPSVTHLIELIMTPSFWNGVKRWSDNVSTKFAADRFMSFSKHSCRPLKTDKKL